MIYHNWWCPTIRVRKLFDPYRQKVWPGMDGPLRWGEVKQAIKDRSYRSSEVPLGVMNEWDMVKIRTEHTRRVAFLAANGWSHPIALHYTPGNKSPIEDGIHRLAAAIISRRDWILCCITGDLVAARQKLKPYLFEDGEPC